MRPALTRSPAHVLTLVAGVIVAIAGWAVATLFDQAIAALSADLQDLVRVFPEWMESAPDVVISGGTVAGVALVHVWLIGTRHFRRLALADVALVVALGASTAVGALVRASLEPTTRALFDDLPETVTRSTPTSPAMAGLVAVLVMVRQWLPVRLRSAIYGATVLLLVTHLAVADSPPYLGILLDVGVGMIVGSAVALALRTPNLQPDQAALVQGLDASGLAIDELHSANVDARGSEPWLGTTTDGQAVFVKALSTDQRAADLLFRAVRWVRLRRTGDAPPEVSLRRAVEHEALVAHHARSLGVATPRVLAVANVGHKKVALAYEGVAGRSIDKVPPSALTDDVVRAIWEQILLLRHHRIAHRDLRLANVFLSDDGEVLLIDFGFAELAASQQLLDTDVAELLAATSTAVGPERAVRLAAECLGTETLEQARDWLHPLAFSTATRRAIAADGLEQLREEVNRLTGHTVADYEPLGRLAPSHVLGLVLGGVAVYSLLALIVHTEISGHVTDIDGLVLAAAVGVGLLAPVLGALSYRAGTGRRTRLRSLVPAAFAAHAPVAAPTSWSFANRILSDAARDGGINVFPAKQAASDRCLATLTSAPLLVAGFAAAGLRTTQGQLVGIGLGLAAGALVALAEVLVIVVVPSGRELTRVWLRPFRSRGVPIEALADTAAWAAAMVTAQGVGFALAARAAGVDTRPELLIALGIAANVIASLVPTPNGVGAVELLSGAGLLVDNSLALAALGAVLGRVALFWIPLPLALWAYRSTRHYRTRVERDEQDDPVAQPLVPAPDGSAATGTDRSWWT